VSRSDFAAFGAAAYLPIVLLKPFREVLRVLKCDLRIAPRGMRRTFQDIARRANVHDLVTRAISGHATEEMHHHYSTAQLDEMRVGVGRVASLLTAAAAND
jgi:hypothetical protein